MQRADVHGKLHVLSTSIAAKLAETDGNGSLALPSLPGIDFMFNNRRPQKS